MSRSAYHYLPQILLQPLTPNRTPSRVQLGSPTGPSSRRSGRVLGILSLGSHRVATFGAAHLRFAKLLAVPAAIAIQNARIHERAEIYAAELELRLRELHEAQTALRRVESSGIPKYD